MTLNNLATCLRHAARGCEGGGFHGAASDFYRLSDDARDGTITASELAELVDYDYRNGHDGKGAAQTFFEALLADSLQEREKS